ncbi:MAG TPA: molybdopterin molybdenumtransferase MoeA [Desulfobacteraceae bacterium]|nr:molybdopterin molybdenumtransferase MoeA [Desulfobacteraceae bacterium]
MKNFFRLISSRDFLELYDRFAPLDAETIPLAQGLGRILAADVISPEPLPPFSRSTMDGFAVRARDTFGCSESEPALLTIAGEIAMGQSGTDLTLAPGQTAIIWTGGELPVNADGVVMVEYTNQPDKGTVEIFRPVAPGENIIRAGEDFPRGATVLHKGQRLRPQDLGVLAGLGITGLQVARKPVAAIISTGDELAEPGLQPEPGKIRDINSTTLTALVEECGGIAVPLGIIGDDAESMLVACRKALALPADMVLLSGGSSVGRRDFTLQTLEGLDGSELLAHGVSIRPGKPTILAKTGNAALFGLPGHVGSAIVVFHLFVRPLLRKLGGAGATSGLRMIRAVTAEQIPSTIGREDFVRVALEWGEDSPPRAVPLYGKSGLLNPLVRADGLLIINRDTEGLDRGEPAEVMLFP